MNHCIVTTEHAMTCMQKQRRSSWDQVRQTGEYIKVHKNQLLQSVRGPQPEMALQSFYGDVSSLCSRPGTIIAPPHLNAIIGATAKAWTLAQPRLSQQKQEHAHHQMHAFLTGMFHRLQTLLPDVEARQAANILWSSAQLRLNPDALLPGMTDSLAQQFMVDMDAAIGQEFANVLVACAKLHISPCQGELFKAIQNRLARADLCNFDPQNVANTLHSLATLPAAAPSTEVLDALCQRFGALLKSRQAAELPDAQNIANTVWALSKLKHAPSHKLAMAMVGRMVALCHLPGHQPTPQNISHVLPACAELSVPVTQADTDSLASLLLSPNNRHATWQHYTNAAWILAVMGHLRQAQLALMLDQILVLSGNPGQRSAPSLVTDAQLTQLYQALDWLQPHPTALAQQQSAWSSLQGKLHSLRPRHVPNKSTFHGIRKLSAALDQLQLPFKAAVLVQSFWVNAVVHSQDNRAQPIILRLSSSDYITNIPDRSCPTLADCITLLKLVCVSSCICSSLSVQATRGGMSLLSTVYSAFVVGPKTLCLCLCCAFACAWFLQDNTFSFLLLACLHTLQVDGACTVQHPLDGQARPAG